MQVRELVLVLKRLLARLWLRLRLQVRVLVQVRLVLLVLPPHWHACCMITVSRCALVACLPLVDFHDGLVTQRWARLWQASIRLLQAGIWLKLASFRP